MRILLGYLIGREDAILAIARSRHSLWISFLFVISAGLARNYDQRDLLHEWWYLLLPIGASLVTSFILYSTAVFAPRNNPTPLPEPFESSALFANSVRPPRKRFERFQFFPNYLVFLSLFWMTAPLAWLYAIPYEQFFSPIGAAVANLLTLGVVSVWRVALMIRVLHTMMSFQYRHAVLIASMVASAVVLMLSFIFCQQTTIFHLMGGLSARATEADQFILLLTNATFYLGGFGAAGAFFLLYIQNWNSTEGQWRDKPASTVSAYPNLSLLLIVSASLFIWVFALPNSQPTQQLRYRVERAFDSDEISQALKLMSAHSPKDFPPHWSPPPRNPTGHGGFMQIVNILDQIEKTDTAPWIRVVYIEKLQEVLREKWSMRYEELQTLTELLHRLPEGKQLYEEVMRRENADPYGFREEFLQDLKQHYEKKASKKK